jgi:hypothetical protein
MIFEELVTFDILCVPQGCANVLFSGEENPKYAVDVRPIVIATLRHNKIKIFRLDLIPYISLIRHIKDSMHICAVKQIGHTISTVDWLKAIG